MRHVQCDKGRWICNFLNLEHSLDMAFLRFFVDSNIFIPLFYIIEELIKYFSSNKITNEVTTTMTAYQQEYIYFNFF